MDAVHLTAPEVCDLAPKQLWCCGFSAKAGGSVRGEEEQVLCSTDYIHIWIYMGVSENAECTSKMASSISFNREHDEGPDFSFSNSHSPTGSWIMARFEGWTMLIERSVVAGAAQFLGARCRRGWAQKLKDRTSVASKYVEVSGRNAVLASPSEHLRSLQWIAPVVSIFVSPFHCFTNWVWSLSLGLMPPRLGFVSRQQPLHSYVPFEHWRSRPACAKLGLVHGWLELPAIAEMLWSPEQVQYLEFLDVGVPTFIGAHFFLGSIIQHRLGIGGTLDILRLAMEGRAVSGKYFNFDWLGKWQMLIIDQRW